MQVSKGEVKPYEGASLQLGYLLANTETDSRSLLLTAHCTGYPRLFSTVHFSDILSSQNLKFVSSQESICGRFNQPVNNISLDVS